MADATAARDVKRSQGDIVTLSIEAGDVLYAGTIVNIDADGFGIKGADTSGHVLGGVAVDTVDNSAGADGAKKIAVYREGTYEFAFSGTVAQTDVGVACYVVDNQTVGLAGTTTNDVLVGTIVEFVDASTVRVKI